MTPHANIGDRLLQRGLTLVEILIAIAVGSILLTGVLQIFLAGKQAYRVLETNARLQENGRFAAEFLSDDVRMAGYLGCFRNDFSSIENNLKTPTAFNWNLGVAIEGYEWTGSGWSPPALPALIAGQVRNGTDVLVVRGLAEDGIHLVPPYPASGPGSAKFFVDQNADDIQDGDIVMVTDCNRASIFQVTNQQVIGTAVNLVHSNSGTFQPGNIRDARG
jgi:type IV pilus assembly protein PilW